MWFCDEMQQNLILFSSNVACSSIFVASCFITEFIMDSVQVISSVCSK